MRRILFLDIDGVMIPATQLLVNRRSSLDRIMAQTALATLAEICRRSGAEIVFNTTHNANMPDQEDIRDAVLRQAAPFGLSAADIHPDCRTRMPVLNRREAIERWLADHPDIADSDWLALDDALFIENDDRLILIDPDAGLHTGHLARIVTHWNLKPLLIGI